MKINKKAIGSDFVYLNPGQSVSETFLVQLKKINQDYSQTKKFLKYCRDIESLFKLSPVTKKTTQCHFFLAGFLEGAGCLNIGAKKNTTSRFKLYLDPEFNLTQHINGISNLYLAMCLFQTGRIRFKSGSLATFVYTIDNRLSLEQKVIPFYENYVILYGCSAKKKRLAVFKKLLQLFKEKAHLDLDKMVYEILPLWDQLRMQKSSNQTFKNLKQAQIYIKQSIQKNDL
jgi:LAGLIDADG endonuclease|uniref:Putative LAGLIDADG homing endonuclease n=1 Tax=Pseudopleurococcus sp. A SAG 2039 TaxID=908851 RepID=A0A1B0RYA8_9CHLO|nr:putative LAGLIDADG homing endonuclease [Pseudopleurococcus sp. A SAG 2039]